MSFTLESVVPWGRSFDEYVSMFSLSVEDLGKRMLGCGDGPASFNAELTRRGGSIISVDPIYQFSSEEIKTRIDETYITVLRETRANQQEFIWTTIKNVDELGAIRMQAMTLFLEDYPEGRVGGRYVDDELPALNFPDDEFELALCSHFLFLYSEQCSQAFHIESILELCRVASEVRIFPILELGAKKSRHLEPVVEYFNLHGFVCELKKVEYEFQKGGNEMLKVSKIHGRASKS